MTNARNLKKENLNTRLKCITIFEEIFEREKMQASKKWLMFIPFIIAVTFSFSVTYLIGARYFYDIQDFIVDYNKWHDDRNKMIYEAVARTLNKTESELTEADFQKVEELHLSGKIADIKPLSKLINLRTLSLCVSIPTGHRPSWLPEFFEIFYKEARPVNIKPLAKLKNLQVLDLTGMKIRSLRTLRGLTNLKSLSLRDTQVGNFGSIASLTNLADITLDNMPISNIRPLRKLTNLQSLKLTRTQFSNIKPVASLKNLQFLYIRDSKISDISPLSGLVNLQKLDLINMNISDIRLLVNLTSLSVLDLSNTQVPPQQIEELQKNLPNVRIYMQ
jgi:hypothetical protein